MNSQIQDLKWSEVEDYLEENDIALLPVGSTEQHGLHLPLMTDTIQAIDTAESAAQQAEVLIAPPIWYGWAPHHMAYPGAVTLRPETLVSLIEDVCYSLIYHGFQKIIIINGHHIANLPPLEIAQTRITNQTGAYIAVVDLNLLIKEEIKELCESQPGGIGHGGELETSWMLYKHRDKVDMSKAVRKLHQYGENFLHSTMITDPRVDGNRVSIKRSVKEEKEYRGQSGSRGDPLLASEDKGKKIFEATVKNLCLLIEEARKVETEVHSKILPL